MNSFFNIISPLDQFEIRDLISLNAPILGNLSLCLTNIGLYLTLGGYLVFVLNIMATNNGKIVSNSWSIGQESVYATVHNVVVNQINEKKGQIYFPFIYVLFSFILINNLIGMIPYNFASISDFVLTFSFCFTIVLGATILELNKHPFASLFLQTRLTAEKAISLFINLSSQTRLMVKKAISLFISLFTLSPFLILNIIISINICLILYLIELPFYTAMYIILILMILSSELISKKCSFIYNIVSIIRDELIKVSIYQIWIWIKQSICIRFFLFSVIKILWLMNVKADILPKIFTIIIVSLLFYTIVISKDRTKSIINLFIRLLIIISFWSTIYYCIDIFDINLYNFLLGFTYYYNYDGFVYTDLGISPYLKELVKDVFKNLDDKLGFSNHHPGGPDSLLIFYDPDIDEEHPEYYHLSIQPKLTQHSIDQYHAKTILDLSDKYYKLLSLKSFTDKYNNIYNHIYNHKTNWHISIANQYINSMDHGRTWSVSSGENPTYDNIINYKVMLSQYTLFAWEDYVLGKAKFYCENKFIISKSNILSNLYIKEKSAYNYWLERQISGVSIFTSMCNKGYIHNFAKDSVFYPEICRDAIFVKTYLVFFNSFFKNLSSQAKMLSLFTTGTIPNDDPFILKVKKFNIHMSYIEKLHSIFYTDAHKCSYELWKSLQNTFSERYIKLLYSSMYYTHTFFPWAALHNSFTCNNLGLGSAWEFGYKLDISNVPAYKPMDITRQYTLASDGLEHCLNFLAVGFNNTENSTIEIKPSPTLPLPSTELGIGLAKTFANNKQGIVLLVN